LARALRLVDDASRQAEASEVEFQREQQDAQVKREKDRHAGQQGDQKYPLISIRSLAR
jgi:hypothetical protein